MSHQVRGRPLLAPTWIDRALSAGAVVLLAIVLTALWRGRAQWGTVPVAVWGHLATILVALALAPLMLLRRRGDTTHRALGWIWVIALFATALVSFAIRRHGQFSAIHLQSIFVVIQTPLIVVWARRHDVAAHRTAVRMTTLGALLIAGFFTFPFGRLLGRWLLG